ncbi:MAG: hypothetical protein HY864_04480 [Chloroflexi bacterium]|nr:hypothetical protein [Chloroflexota bacterium]
MKQNIKSSTSKPQNVTPFVTVSFSNVIALIVAISYGGGLWVNIQHGLEGAHEAVELPPIIHLLRDSTFAMLFIFFGVLMAVSFSRWLIQRANGRMPRMTQWALISVTLGVFTGTAFALGIPAHGYLFGAHLEEGAELIADLLKDGSQVALVNIGISALIFFAQTGFNENLNQLPVKKS